MATCNSPAKTPTPAHSPPDEESDEVESGDGSSPGSSILGDGPGSDEAFRAKIRAKNRPCCPTALTAALQSLAAQELEEEGSGSGSAGSEAGSESESGDQYSGSSPSSSPRAIIITDQPHDDPSLGAPLLDQAVLAPASLGAIRPMQPIADPLPLETSSPASGSAPPLLSAPIMDGSVAAAIFGSVAAVNGSVLDGSSPVQPPTPVSVPVVSAPATALVDATSALAGSRPTQTHGSRSSLSVPSAVVGAEAAKTAAAAVVGSDTARKYQSELHLIRAQLNTLKGKDLANYQRGRIVDGRNYKSGHKTMVQNTARQVFVKKSKPTFVGPMPNSAAYRPSHAKGQPPPSLSKPWVAAVCSNLDEKRINLAFRPPNVENGEIIVEASDESLNMARSRWSDYLVGHFLEGRLPFPSVEEIANRMWAKFGLMETLSFNKEFFLFKFPEASSREKLLDHGPFLFGGRPFILQQWTPSLVLSKVCLSKIPLWAKIYNIPLAMWNPIGLGDIASAIGVPLFADSTTENLQRFDFARICVEVDASKPLMDEFKLRVQGKVVKLQVEYQWRPKRCPKCCTFGHLCPSAPPPSGPRTGSTTAGSRAAACPLSSSGFGSVLGPVPGPVTAPNHVPSPVPVHVPATNLVSVPGSSLNLSVPAVNHVPVPAPVLVPAPRMVSGLEPDPASVTAPCPGPDPSLGPASASKTTPAPAGSFGYSPPSAGPASTVGLNPVGSLSVDHHRYVDGLVCDEDDSEDNYVEGLNSDLFYNTHSPKTRGQKARKELSLTFIPPQPKGSGKKGKKKGKRPKR